jgi:hypothetical protein
LTHCSSRSKAGLCRFSPASQVCFPEEDFGPQHSIRSCWFYRVLLSSSMSSSPWKCNAPAGAVYKYDVSLPISQMYALVEEMRTRLTTALPHLAGSSSGAGSGAGSDGSDDDGPPPIRVAGYGHLGDGNLHLNISGKCWMAMTTACSCTEVLVCISAAHACCGLCCLWARVSCGVVVGSFLPLAGTLPSLAAVDCHLLHCLVHLLSHCLRCITRLGCCSPGVQPRDMRAD